MNKDILEMVQVFIEKNPEYIKKGIELYNKKNTKVTPNTAIKLKRDFTQRIDKLEGGLLQELSALVKKVLDLEEEVEIAGEKISDLEARIREFEIRIHDLEEEEEEEQ